MTRTRQRPLAGQVAVIAGGTGGIGYASAAALAGAGADVVLLTRGDTRAAERRAAELPGSGHGALQAHMADSASLNRAAEEVRARWGRANILVNAAGMTRPVPHRDLDGLDDALIDEIFVANWRGPFATIRAFAPLLRESGDALVVNISSIAASTGIGSNVAYCAAKAGLDIMAASLGRALAPEIRVLNVSPGVVDTDFVPGRDASFNERAAAGTPLRRVGTVEDIADAVLACATSLRYATGTVITIDGGRRLGAAG